MGVECISRCMALVFRPMYILEANTVGESRLMYTLGACRQTCTQVAYRHLRTLRVYTLAECRQMYTGVVCRRMYKPQVGCKRMYTALASILRYMAEVYTLSCSLVGYMEVEYRLKYAQEVYILK
jgi:hypothetical protein